MNHPLKMYRMMCTARVPQVVSLYDPVDARNAGLIERQSLPNMAFPSDHLPVGATLRLKHFYVQPYESEAEGAACPGAPDASDGEEAAATCNGDVAAGPRGGRAMAAVAVAGSDADLQGMGRPAPPDAAGA